MQMQTNKKNDHFPGQEHSDLPRPGEIVPLNGGHNEKAFLAQYGQAKMLHNVMDQPACQRLNSMHWTTHAKEFMQRRLSEEGFTELQINEFANEMDKDYELYDQQIRQLHRMQKELEEDRKEDRQQKSIIEQMNDFERMQHAVDNSFIMKNANKEYEEEMAKIKRDEEMLARSKDNFTPEEYQRRQMDIEMRKMSAENTRDFSEMVAKDTYNTYADFNKEMKQKQKEEYDLREKRYDELQKQRDEYNAKVESGEIEGEKMRDIERPITNVEKRGLMMGGVEAKTIETQEIKIETQEIQIETNNLNM